MVELHSESGCARAMPPKKKCQRCLVRMFPSFVCKPVFHNLFCQSLCGKFWCVLAPWCSGTSSTTEMGNASAFSNDAVLYDFAHRHASLEPWHCPALCCVVLHVLHSMPCQSALLGISWQWPWCVIVSCPSARTGLSFSWCALLDGSDRP